MEISQEFAIGKNNNSVQVYPRYKIIVDILEQIILKGKNEKSKI